MEILIPDFSYDNPEFEYEEFKNYIKDEMNIFSNDVRIEKSIIGREASWPTIIAIFGGLVTLFLSGEVIDKNINAWISIGKKIDNFIKRIKNKFKRDVYLDEQAASLLILNHIHEKGKVEIQTIEKVSEEIFTVHPNPNDGKPKGIIDSRPEAIYIQNFIINKTIIYSFVIKSTGKIEREYRFDKKDWMKFS